MNAQGQPKPTSQQDDAAFDARHAVPPALPGFDDIDEIAHGGQAVIYSAIQRSTRRRVAIKVLRDGAFASRASLRRFEREIEIVAGFHHPNIVQIYDSGTTPDGHAYCVMEFVQGVTIDEHVRTLFDKLPASDAIREVVRLFSKICDALNYSHQHGVIHRDIKPGNILVVEVSAVGTIGPAAKVKDASPRILDFGLAKHERRGASNLSNTTESGYFLGSLQWASPEQVAETTVDTRSDVYSLGITCYYLLTRHFPYKVNGSLHDITESILHASPASPTVYRREIGSDLETVLLKCLTKAPEDRYQTAGELKADLQRILAGEPIAARRESAWRATKRTVARYRAMVTAAAVALIMLVAFAIWMSLLYSRANRAEVTARAEAMRAADESEKARAVTTFIQTVLSSADPGKQGYRVTIVEALDLAAGRVGEDFKNQPEIESAIELTLGQAYQNLGLTQKASRHYRRASELLQMLLDPEHPDVIDAIERLALTLNYNVSAENEAKILFARVLNARRKTPGPNHRETLSTEFHYFSQLNMPGLYPNALEDVNRLSAKCDALFGPGDELAMDFVLLHARTLVTCGRLSEGESRYKEALIRLESHPDPEYRSRLATLAEYGGLLAVLGRDSEAATLFRRSVEVKQRVLGTGHQATLCTKTDMIPSLCNIGELDLAERSAAEALQFAEAGGEEYNGVLFRALFAMGYVNSVKGRDEVAHSQYERAIESYRRSFGEGLPYRYMPWAIENKLKTARINDALSLSLELARQIESIFGDGDYRALEYRCLYGRALAAAKRTQEARDTLTRAVGRLAKLLGENHPNVRLARSELESLKRDTNP